MQFGSYYKWSDPVETDTIEISRPTLKKIVTCDAKSFDKAVTQWLRMAAAESRTAFS